MERIDGRRYNELRPVTLTKDYILYPEGSVLVTMGNTKVICNVSYEDHVPAFKKDSGEGWLTAEYAMLPRATKDRSPREINKLRKNKRAVEIQRLIGRSLRAVVDFEKMGECTMAIDCDVIQADGGTRTAAITGAYVALVLAFRRLVGQGVIKQMPIKGMVSAISVGIVGGRPVCDLSYVEDSNAKVDMNVVMTDRQEYVELQGTGEQAPFTKDELSQLLALAEEGNLYLQTLQRQVLEGE